MWATWVLQEIFILDAGSATAKKKTAHTRTHPPVSKKATGLVADIVDVEVLGRLVTLRSQSTHYISFPLSQFCCHRMCHLTPKKTHLFSKDGICNDSEIDVLVLKTRDALPPYSSLIITTLFGWITSYRLKL